MGWLNVGWLQVVWFVVVVYVVTAAVVHVSLRRLLRRRDAAEAEARGEQLPERMSSWPYRRVRNLSRRIVVLGAGVRRTCRLIAHGGPPEVALLPRPNMQVPQIAARPSRPAPAVGLSEGVPTAAITLVPRQRVVDLTLAEQFSVAEHFSVAGHRWVPEDGAPVRWWHEARS